MKFVIPLVLTLTLTGCFSSNVITWQDNSDNETEFIVSRKMSDEVDYTIIAYLPENTTEYTDLSLDSTVKYCYIVSASNEVGVSDSEEVCTP